MYVFLLAGCEVVLSAVVLATCNFLFIKKKPSAPADKLESITLTDDCNTKMCSNRAEGNDDEEKGEREEQEKMIKKEENKDNEGIDDVRPKSVTVDSQEVERFLKEPQPNGNMAASPETCL
ncbi:hypothetical protein XENORESO_008017 [Xenotaenia resolanae]|uniref:Uncharacterized protein n=2 Tax=Goodeidae TaxID=28758 RepID=A0ABV0X4X5_9TELE